MLNACQEFGKEQSVEAFGTRVAVERGVVKFQYHA